MGCQAAVPRPRLRAEPCWEPASPQGSPLHSGAPAPRPGPGRRGCASSSQKQSQPQGPRRRAQGWGTPKGRRPRTPASRHPHESLSRRPSPLGCLWKPEAGPTGAAARGPLAPAHAPLHLPRLQGACRGLVPWQRAQSPRPSRSASGWTSCAQIPGFPGVPTFSSAPGSRPSPTTRPPPAPTQPSTPPPGPCLHLKLLETPALPVAYLPAAPPTGPPRGPGALAPQWPLLASPYGLHMPDPSRPPAFKPALA